MAQVDVHAGICGMQSRIETTLLDDGRTVRVEIESSCESVRRLAGQLSEVNAYQEISYRKEGPRTLQLARECLPHTACPVPAAIIKAVEVAAGLALPADVMIKISK